MRREGTIGLTAALVIAAAVGISFQTGPKPEAIRTGSRVSSPRGTEPAKTLSRSDTQPGCGSLADELAEFLDLSLQILPDSCYGPGKAPKNVPPAAKSTNAGSLKFVVAFLPDPVHTHLAALFDQFVTAVQEGAQDEKYDFDSSWVLGRATSTPTRCLGMRRPRAARRIGGSASLESLCFARMRRRAARRVWWCSSSEKGPPQGIHRDPFENAPAWIQALAKSGRKGRIGILGPTFSGSLGSLQSALSDSLKAGSPGSNRGSRL